MKNITEDTERKKIMETTSLPLLIMSSPATGDQIMTVVGIGGAICVVLVIIVLLMGRRRK